MARSRRKQPPAADDNRKEDEKEEKQRKRALPEDVEENDSVIDLTEEKVLKKKREKKIDPKKIPDTVPLTLNPNAGKEGKQSMLVELASLDLANDTGAIGRLNLRGDDLRIDVKSLEHAANIRPCKALLLITVGPEEAKIESIVSEYVAITRTDDALNYLGQAAIVQGDVDDSFKQFQNDIDVNKRIREPEQRSTGTNQALRKTKPSTSRPRKPSTNTKKKIVAAPSTT